MGQRKEVFVRDMFAQIAPTYDLLNSVLSLNVHKLWRPVALRAAELQPGAKVLDLATGTCDVALLAAREVGPGGTVVGVDFCEPILRHGQAKVRGRQAPRVRLAVGSASHLPFGDDTFDAALMAFAARNVPSVERCFEEMARVVRPGGWVVNLELTRPEHPLLAAGYRWYQDQVMPTIGGWVSGQRSAYRYLPRSVQAFPPPERLAQVFRRAGLEDVSWRSLTGGLATVHRGRKR